MGSSSTGLLFLGIDLADYDWWNEETEEEIDWYEISDEWKKMNQPTNFDYQPHSSDWTEWRNEVTLWEKTSPSNISIKSYGYMDEPYTFIAIGYHVFKSYDFGVEMVDVGNLHSSVTLIEEKELREFCKFAGVEYKEPKWYLGSYYG
jgi:hypothetical protein